MKDKSIHAHIYVVSNATAFDKPGLVTQCAKRRHQPAIAIAALPYVVGRGSVDEELGVVENVDDSFDSQGSKHIFRIAISSDRSLFVDCT